MFTKINYSRPAEFVRKTERRLEETVPRRLEYRKPEHSVPITFEEKNKTTFSRFKLLLFDPTKKICIARADEMDLSEQKEHLEKKK